MEKFQTPGITSSAYSKDPLPEGLRKLLKSRVVKSLLATLGADADLHLVGGTLRNVYENQPTGDLDLCTRLRPEAAVERLMAARIRVIETGLQHGTITAVIGRSSVEITTFRKGNGSSDNEFSDSIEEDLAGRDFTINALAFSLNNHELIDAFGARKDLESRILRAVGDPHDRFREDPLRIMRMLRFGPAAGRSVDKSTYDAAASHVSSLRDVSVERIRDEFIKILVSSAPAAALRAMVDLKIMEIVVPEALASVGFEQNRFHDLDVFEHTLQVIENCPPDAAMRLIGFFHDLGKPATLSTDENGNRHFYQHEVVGEKMTKSIMKRLKFSNAVQKRVAAVVKYHMRPLNCGPSGLRRLIRDLGSYFEDWKDFKRADIPSQVEGEKILAQLQKFEEMLAAEKIRLSKVTEKKLAIDGHDLISIGMQPGSELGRVLKALEEMVIEDPSLNSKEVLIERARGLI